ncbi:MAG TPA: LysM peptidoglycan-binding domain-containing protein [Gaiellaceae bacterium]|jgi:LysM repeat protein|nr:LysM peptidoglycan-binding domain-containing protein [Gaiellaceae bacterium]
MFARVLFVTVAIALGWSVLARGSEGAGAAERYRVRPGDTLWSIAATRYHGDLRQAVWRVQRENDLGSAVLQPGQVLLLP